MTIVVVNGTDLGHVWGGSMVPNRYLFLVNGCALQDLHMVVYWCGTGVE